MAEHFQYEVIFSKGDIALGVPIWFWGSSGQPIGRDLLNALNTAGQQGWEVSGTADIYASSRADIILKRRCI